MYDNLYIPWHGKYCGPMYSGGEKQPSLKYGVGPEAIDSFDESCRVHDGQYFDGNDLRSADLEFFYKNFGYGDGENLVKRNLAALAVGVQGYFRKKKIMPPANRGRSLTRSPAASSLSRIRSAYSSSAPSYRSRRSDFTMRSPSFGSSRGLRSVSFASSAHSGGSGGGGSGYLKSKKRKRGKGKSRSKKSKRSKKKKTPNWLKTGTILKTESGWQQSNSQCAYTGAGTPINTIYIVMIRALVSCIANQLGAPIRSWHQIAGEGDQFTLKFKYQDEGNNTISPVDVNCAVGSSWASIASQIVAQFRLTFTTRSKGQFLEVVVLTKGAGTGTTDLMRKIIRLDNMFIDLEYHVSMKVQNLTKSDGNSNALDVNNTNPIEGKFYVFNDNKIWRRDNVVNPNPALLWSVNPDDGSMLNQFTILPRELLKPTSSSYFRKCLETIPFKLAPGAIIRKAVMRKQVFNFNRAMRVLLDAFEAPALTVHDSLMEVGKILLVGAEKMLDTREALPQPVELGIQTDYIFKSSYHFNKQKGSIVDNEISGGPSIPLV